MLIFLKPWNLKLLEHSACPGLYRDCFNLYSVRNFTRVCQEVWKVRVEIRLIFEKNMNFTQPVFTNSRLLHTWFWRNSAEFYGNPTNDLVVDAGSQEADKRTDWWTVGRGLHVMRSLLFSCHLTTSKAASYQHSNHLKRVFCSAEKSEWR